MYVSPEKVAAKVIKAIYHIHGLVLVAHLARLLWLVKRLTPRLWDFACRARKKRTQNLKLLTVSQAGSQPPN